MRHPSLAIVQVRGDSHTHSYIPHIMVSHLRTEERAHMNQPRSDQEITTLLASGQISVIEAMRYFRDLSAGASEPEPQQPAPPPAMDAMSELGTLVGISRVKELVAELQAYIQINRCRAAEHLATEPMVLHMIFKGNPGTGKTTVARILGRLMCELGVLPKGHLVETERADLVGEYIGHTAQKTREQINRAMGGILFIDEAYSLARGGEKDFGKEAIDTMVKAMEDHKDELILILAGYKDEMEWFLQQNPGLRSRFPIILSFDDFSEDELMQIGREMLKRRQYRMSPAAEQRLAGIIRTHMILEQKNFGNARLVRNLIELAIRRQAVRLVTKTPLTRDNLMTIEAEDIADRREY
jgi:stage V sporulation protein K